MSGGWRHWTDFLPVISDVSGSSEASFWLCGHTSPLMPNEAREIVCDIGHANLHRCPLDADGSDEELHLRLLPGKDMLDEGADFRASAIGP